MTTGQWFSIMTLICIVFTITTTIFGAFIGSAIGSLLVGAAMAWGASQPGGTGWK